MTEQAQEPEPVDYAKLVRNYQLAYAMCRVWGHPWEWQGDVMRHDGSGGWDTHLYCPRCTSSRISIRDARGRPDGNTYPDRPKDYPIPGLPWDADARAAISMTLHSPKYRRLMTQMQQRK